MRRQRNTTPPTARESRPARPAPETSAHVLAAKLYEIHNEAGRGEPYLERWPGDTELYGALEFAQEHADRLTGDAYREAALLRVQLSEWLRLAADPFQLAAIDDARAGGTSWAEVALALRYLNRQGQPNPGSAMNLRKRLHVAVNGRPGDRRQPQVAHVVDQRAAEARIAEQLRIAAGEAIYAELDAAARSLLRHHAAGDIAEDPDGDRFWWDELAAVVDDRQDARERANLGTYVRGVVRETLAYARRASTPHATTEQAREALETAARLVGITTGS